MKKVLVIEDDIKLREELIKFLTMYEYECYFISDFENLFNEFLNIKADIVLLDVNLPYYDGYHVCREIRKKSKVPIIMLTSRNSDMDELMSLNLGADDFITKPYNPQILLAHMSAVLSRTETNVKNDILSHKDVFLDLSKGEVNYGEKKIDLTKNEIKILGLLIRNKGRIVSRDDIMNELWQSDEFVDDNTLTVNINRLRKKLEDIGVLDYIETRRGQGYII